MIGVKPKEFYCMTENDYMKIVLGHRKKELETMRLHRHLTYTIYCGYSSKPMSISKFMPLDGDSIEVYERPEQGKLIEWDKKFRSL